MQHITERSSWKQIRALLVAGTLATMPAAAALAAGMGAANGMPPAQGQQGQQGMQGAMPAHKTKAECETDARAQGLHGTAARKFVKTCEGKA